MIIYQVVKNRVSALQNCALKKKHNKPVLLLLYYI